MGCCGWLNLRGIQKVLAYHLDQMWFNLMNKTTRMESYEE